MDPDTYRRHAQGCREAAADATTEAIRRRFLAAAATWEVMALQLEWLTGAERDPDRTKTLTAARLRHATSRWLDGGAETAADSAD